MITEAKRSRPKNGTPVPELFRCVGAPVRGLTVLAATDRRAIDAALSEVRVWAATRDDGPALDEMALSVLAVTIFRQHIAPLRAELDQARAAADEAGRALAVAEAELAERREVERAARVRKEMASERRSKDLREQVRQRDGDNCRMCGTDLEAGAGVLDHVAPDLAAGVENLVMACASCRRKRKGRTLDAAGMSLLPVPAVPRVATTPIETDAASEPNGKAETVNLGDLVKSVIGNPAAVLETRDGQRYALDPESAPYMHEGTLIIPIVGDDSDGDDGCPGHESLDGAHMGESVYCDGSCRRGERR